MRTVTKQCRRRPKRPGVSRRERVSMASKYHIKYDMLCYDISYDMTYDIRNI